VIDGMVSIIFEEMSRFMRDVNSLTNISNPNKEMRPKQLKP
jgi:hypothetical protein